MTNLLRPSAENTKIESFLTFLWLTLGVNMIIRQIALFFPSTRWALSNGISIFFKTLDFQNSILWGLGLHYDLVCKIHIYMPNMTLSTKISLFYQKFANFCYITFCSQFEGELVLIPWTSDVFTYLLALFVSLIFLIYLIHICKRRVWLFDFLQVFHQIQGRVSFCYADKKDF